MFRWYKKAEVCYVYLSDVPGYVDVHDRSSAFSRSRWFTRGWTLQELIAPSTVHFYARCGTYLGSKGELLVLLAEITGIAKYAMQATELRFANASTKMSWAAHRETTRYEDVAYCLLGIFDINMPMIYGEGKKAFLRLQEEIIKPTDDHSIFAWGMTTDIVSAEQFLHDKSYGWRRQTQIEPTSDQSVENAGSKRQILYKGLFADSPADLANCKRIARPATWFRYSYEQSYFSMGESVRVELPFITSSTSNPKSSGEGNASEAHISFQNGITYFGLLNCVMEDKHVRYFIVLPLKAWDLQYFGRVGSPVCIAQSEESLSSLKKAILVKAKYPHLYLLDEVWEEWDD